MRHFTELYDIALQRKVSQELIELSLPTPKTHGQLATATDAFYLSTMSRRVFQAGFRHAVVNKKWPDIETLFHDFDPNKVLWMSDDELASLMENPKMIRHWGRIRTVQKNAQFIEEIAREHVSMGQFIADWPEDNIIELWSFLKRRATRLGGNSGPSFLRMVGKDTFLLTNDVVAALKREEALDKNPTCRRDWQQVQDAFNQWQQQSGRPLCQISRLLSYTIGFDSAGKAA